MDEFSDPAMNEVPDYLTDDQFRSERRQEFKNNVDADRNGRVNKMELLVRNFVINKGKGFKLNFKFY